MIIQLQIIIVIFSISTAYAAEDPLVAASRIASSGMNAQNNRLKVVAQNIANSEVTAETPEADPYRRQIIFFKNEYDDKVKANILKIDRIDYDKSEFELRYQPSHPAADQNGLVKYPNINKIIEIADAKEAQSSFEANAMSFEITKRNQLKIIDLMR